MIKANQLSAIASTCFLWFRSESLFLLSFRRFYAEFRFLRALFVAVERAASDQGLLGLPGICRFYKLA